MSSDQYTIERTVSLVGSGLFTGRKVRLSLIPAPVNAGIFFRRQDLPKAPPIPAHYAWVSSTFRSTSLAKQGASVLMVEHLLSALKAIGIDNLEILVDGPEIPSGDGSALLFVEALEKAGIVSQPACKNRRRLLRPVYYAQGDTRLVALPAKDLHIHYTLDYPGVPLLSSQYYAFSLTPEAYLQEIAPARTFALQEEIEALQKKGLLQNASLDQGISIEKGSVLNPGGLRFPEEMARHKILDLIGDLSLTGVDFGADIFAIRSGHAAHIAFCPHLVEAMEPSACPV
ncbi:MAG: UDP-3-O-acyl-N-acetylglucosamine deacetylase [Chlamydiota bacterium]